MEETIIHEKGVRGYEQIFAAGRTARRGDHGDHL